MSHNGRSKESIDDELDLEVAQLTGSISGAFKNDRKHSEVFVSKIFPMIKVEAGTQLAKSYETLKTSISSTKEFKSKGYLAHCEHPDREPTPEPDDPDFQAKFGIWKREVSWFHYSKSVVLSKEEIERDIKEYKGSIVYRCYNDTAPKGHPLHRVHTPIVGDGIKGDEWHRNLNHWKNELKKTTDSPEFMLESLKAQHPDVFRQSKWNGRRLPRRPKREHYYKENLYKASLRAFAKNVKKLSEELNQIKPDKPASLQAEEHDELVIDIDQDQEVSGIADFLGDVVNDDEASDGYIVSKIFPELSAQKVKFCMDGYRKKSAKLKVINNRINRLKVTKFRGYHMHSQHPERQPTPSPDDQYFVAKLNIWENEVKMMDGVNDFKLTKADLEQLISRAKIIEPYKSYSILPIGHPLRRVSTPVISNDMRCKEWNTVKASWIGRMRSVTCLPEFIVEQTRLMYPEVVLHPNCPKIPVRGPSEENYFQAAKAFKRTVFKMSENLKRPGNPILPLNSGPLPKQIKVASHDLIARQKILSAKRRTRVYQKMLDLKGEIPLIELPPLTMDIPQLEWIRLANDKMLRIADNLNALAFIQNKIGAFKCSPCYQTVVQMVGCDRPQTPVSNAPHDLRQFEMSVDQWIGSTECLLRRLFARLEDVMQTDMTQLKASSIYAEYLTALQLGQVEFVESPNCNETSLKDWERTLTSWKSKVETALQNRRTFPVVGPSVLESFEARPFLSESSEMVPSQSSTLQSLGDQCQPKYSIKTEVIQDESKPALDFSVIMRLEPETELLDYVQSMAAHYGDAAEERYKDCRHFVGSLAGSCVRFVPCGSYNKDNSCSSSSFIHLNQHGEQRIHSCALCYFAICGMINSHEMSKCPLLEYV